MPHLRRAFTLIELLVVITIIVLLLAILVPSLSPAIEQANLAVCASNQHQLSLATFSYAATNNRSMPYYPDVYNGNWLWDLPIKAADALSMNAQLKPEYFYCPLNPDQSAQGLWDFAYPSFRVTGYFFLFRRAPNQGPMGDPGAALANDNVWIRNLISSKAPSSAPLITDATIAANGDFTYVPGGYAIPHHTAHLSSTTRLPKHGNINFLDRHTALRLFNDMRLQYNYASPDQWF